MRYLGSRSILAKPKALSRCYGGASAAFEKFVSSAVELVEREGGFIVRLLQAEVEVSGARTCRHRDQPQI